MSYSFFKPNDFVLWKKGFYVVLEVTAEHKWKQEDLFNSNTGERFSFYSNTKFEVGDLRYQDLVVLKVSDFDGKRNYGKSRIKTTSLSCTSVAEYLESQRQRIIKIEGIIKELSV